MNKRKEWLNQQQPNAVLVEIYNLITKGSINRFADRKAGIRRILKAADADAEVGARLDRLVNVTRPAITVRIEDVLADSDKPLLTVGEVLEQVAEKEAEAYETRTVEGTELVVVNGRTVRPENAAKVRRGEALWGSLAGSVPEPDKLRGVNQDINLNYPVKAKVAKLRSGTGRAKLVEAMRENGVTVEDVMKMFNVKREAAIYKLRDLHYVGGHGLETRKGRVYIVEPSPSPVEA